MATRSKSVSGRSLLDRILSGSSDNSIRADKYSRNDTSLDSFIEDHSAHDNSKVDWLQLFYNPLQLITDLSHKYQLKIDKDTKFAKGLYSAGDWLSKSSYTPKDESAWEGFKEAWSSNSFKLMRLLMSLGILYNKFSGSSGSSGRDWSSGSGAGAAASAAGAAASAVASGSGSGSSPSSSSNDLINTILGGSQSNSSNFLGSILSSLAGFGSQYASSILNYDNQAKLIDKQNAYNTPAAQMQRFEAAGLNPNLVYGLGSNGNQPSSGSIAPVDFDTSQRENRLARFQMDIQSKLAASEIAQRGAQADLLAQQSAGQRLSNDTFMETWENEQRVKIQQLHLLEQQTREASANAHTAKERANYAHELAELEKQIAEAERNIQNKRAQWAEANEITNAIGNIFHVGFGVNFGRSYNRSNNTTISQRVY